MEVRAVMRYARMSCKKVQDVTRVLVGRKAGEALQMLKFIPRKSARIVAKTLTSAIANATNQGMNSEALFVKEAMAEQGIAFKRFIPASKGSAHPIKKRTSHVRVILTDNLE